MYGLRVTRSRKQRGVAEKTKFPKEPPPDRPLSFRLREESLHLVVSLTLA